MQSTEYTTGNSKLTEQDFLKIMEDLIVRHPTGQFLGISDMGNGLYKISTTAGSMYTGIGGIKRFNEIIENKY